MRDVFEYVGIPMSEAMAFGLDATMGFGYFDKSNMFTDITEEDIPFFLGGKQGTIDPNSLACRLLGVNLRKQSFTSANKAWEEAKVLLDKDVPLILRVDIGYLPYFKWEEDQDVHFGGHAITLAGYDEAQGIAYVGDTEFDGFKEVPIEDLKKARDSMEGPAFLRAGNTQFSMSRRPDCKRPPLAAGVKLAIQQVCNNMLRPSINNNGIQGLKLFANSIPKWSEELNRMIKGKTQTSLARFMFELIYGYIEAWGTGGSAFRKLYGDFLKELRILPEIKEGPKAWNQEDFNVLDESIILIDASSKNWMLIAMTLKNAADKHKNDCINHINLENLRELVLTILKQEEELFKKLSKIKV